MKLDVRERIALANLLPKKGSFEALKTIRRAKEMLAFTPEELEFFEMVEGDNGIWRWNPEKAVQNVKDVPVDEYTKNLVTNKLIQLSNEGELTDQHFSLYEKFVIAYK